MTFYIHVNHILSRKQASSGLSSLLNLMLANRFTVDETHYFVCHFSAKTLSLTGPFSLLENDHSKPNILSWNVLTGQDRGRPSNEEPIRGQFIEIKDIVS